MKFIILLVFSLLGYINPDSSENFHHAESISESADSPELGKKAELKLRKEISTFAKKFVGKKYKYAAMGPNKFDCSGYTSFIYHHFNVKLDRASKYQAKQGKKKKVSQLKEADLVFFGNQNQIQHVGIVLEASKDRLLMIHCSSSRGVIVEDVYKSDYWQEKLLFGKDVINN